MQNVRWGDSLTMTTLASLTRPPRLNADKLQRLFGLTAVEARLALEMARGLSLREALESLEIEMPIARSQMASIFIKTGTQHQSELVVLLSRLTALYSHDRKGRH